VFIKFRKPYRYTNLDQSGFQLNFCENVPNGCYGNPGTIIGWDLKGCKLLAGDSLNANQWSLKSNHNILI
jgi:hypothetical protein